MKNDPAADNALDILEMKIMFLTKKKVFGLPKSTFCDHVHENLLFKASVQELRDS